MADTLGRLIQFKQGTRISLPELKVGEPAFCTDDKTFWIGSAVGNVQVGTRKKYLLYNSTLTTGEGNIVLPDGFDSLDDFDELIVSGTMLRTEPSHLSRYNNIIIPSTVIQRETFFSNMEVMTLNGDTYSMWLRGVVNKETNKVVISYNRERTVSGSVLDTTKNTVEQIYGIKYI